MNTLFYGALDGMPCIWSWHKVEPATLTATATAAYGLTYQRTEVSGSVEWKVAHTSDMYELIGAYLDFAI